MQPSRDTTSQGAAESGSFELIGSRGCGSAIVEAALRLTGLPFHLTDLPYLKPGPGRDRLLRLNVSGQVPTLVLPCGGIMTESAAMILHLHDLAPHAGLVPPPGTPERWRFWNLLERLIGSVYPTFTYGDDPAKWAGPGAAAELMRVKVHDRRAELWQEIEREIGAPHALGAHFSALDLYVAVMTRWRPGPGWFRGTCPKLAAVAETAALEPQLAAVLDRHFDPPLE
ncbi:glutathione S-transferase N-terminal domain-containing protein [Pseudomonadota bacterium AL_CKDN230030165-1A_HGKHYDSX7]